MHQADCGARRCLLGNRTSTEYHSFLDFPSFGILEAGNNFVEPNADTTSVYAILHLSLLDAYGVRSFGSEIKSNKFDFASFALHAFPPTCIKRRGFKTHLLQYEHLFTIQNKSKKINLSKSSLSFFILLEKSLVNNE